MCKIKLFEQFNHIDEICREYSIKNYTINTDGTVDVKGNVYIANMKLTEIPLRFGIVTGDFDCDNNKLTSLDGSPSQSGSFDCSFNYLQSFVGGPRRVLGDFYCSANEFYSLDGLPDEISGQFNSPIKIQSIFKIFGGYQEFKSSLDWNYLRGDRIIKSRFEEACEEAGVVMPIIIRGYKYI